jgi:hypothetical protein
MKKLQSEQDRLLVQETEIEEYASQLDKTRDALQAKEEQLKIESQKAESRSIMAEKMIRESLEKLKENQELELKLEQSKSAFESEKQFIQDHIHSIEAKEVEIDEKEKAIVHRQNVEFRQRMEYLDREYHAKTAALDERIAAVHEFDLSHVEKISKQESKIAALEQEIHALQKVLLDKDAQIVAVTETRANKQGPSEFSGTQRSLEAQLESFRSSLKDVRPADLTTNGSSSRIASLFLPEIHVSSENDLESTGAAQIRVKDPAPRISVGSTARVAMEQQNSEAQTGLEGSVVHRSSMRSALSTASLRNREFPSLSQSNMFMTPQTSRILDQHTKPLSYSLQKLAPAVTHDFSLSMASMSGNASNFARTQLQLPGETHHESSKSAAFSAEVDEMQRKIGRRLDALRESRLQKSEGKF